MLADGENETGVWTYQEVDRKARAVAAYLQAHNAEGQRVLLLYPSCLEFIAAYFGCLYAGAVAVPAFPPRLNRNLLRLQTVFEDASPTVVFTTSAMLPKREAVPDMSNVPWVATELFPDVQAESWVPPQINGDTVAFLQYTSGSTSHPKGVMVTHANLMANHRMMQTAFEQDLGSTFVTWLPLFHDMGLISKMMQALYLGGHCILMPPETFVMKPFRWLKAISRYKAHTSGGPNFAYDLCVRKVTAAQMAELDLSSWKVALNAAEPVRTETIESFTRTFSACGFRKETFYPCYGLAEATLFVTGGLVSEPPVMLAPGDRVEGGLPASRRASCGWAWLGAQVRVVDPETRVECPPGITGEIWISGPLVAAGYWKNPEATVETFQATIAATGEGPFLRTGDLGFMVEGELYVDGRIKDLVIIDGQNHHPNDIEQTAEESHPLVRVGGTAAFSILVNEKEQLVVMVEVERASRGQPNAPAVSREEAQKQINEIVRSEVSAQHGIRVHDLVLLPPSSLPKTSSGKIQRHAARKLYFELKNPSPAS